MATIATEHLTTVETAAELPEPVAGFRVLVTGESAVYVAEEVDGTLSWVLSTTLGQ